MLLLWGTGKRTPQRIPDQPCPRCGGGGGGAPGWPPVPAPGLRFERAQLVEPAGDAVRGHEIVVDDPGVSLR